MTSDHVLYQTLEKLLQNFGYCMFFYQACLFPSVSYHSGQKKHFLSVHIRLPVTNQAGCLRCWIISKISLIVAAGLFWRYSWIFIFCRGFGNPARNRNQQRFIFSKLTKSCCFLESGQEITWWISAPLGNCHHLCLLGNNSSYTGL